MGMTVEQVMSKSVFSVGRDQTLETAHQLMEKHHVRHLPVLEGGKVVGIVSERDLYLLESLRDVHQFDVSVENAMSADPFTVKPHTPLAEVCETMAQHKYGAALITEGNKVVGMFTAVDALTVLSRMLKTGKAI